MTVDHLYLSPHLDDVVLSCGGLIRQQCANGESVLVISVFTQSALSSELSPFAKAMHRIWTDQLDPFAVRRAEDESAMRDLGAQFLHLNHLSAMYRRDREGHSLYQGVGVFGKLHPDEVPLTEMLAAEFMRLRLAHPQATIYVPLAVGYHVDHQHVNLAARHLPGKIRFYEDFPYIIFGALSPLLIRLLGLAARFGVRPMDNPDARAYPLTWPALLRAFRTAPSFLGKPGPAQAKLGPLEWQDELYPIDLAAKIQDAMHYASQIGMLFGSEHNLCNALETYSLSLGAKLGVKGPHERLWLALAPVRVRVRR
jgi:LmbE family N-acetylglucosaminyl deacetylase